MRLEDDLNTVRLEHYPVERAILFCCGQTYHHINGPAVIYYYGHKEYCINNKWLSEKEWLNATRR